MKDKLLDIFNTVSHKHISSHISREHPEMISWIDASSSGIKGLDTFNQKIRYVLFGDIPVCEKSNKDKRWISLSGGYGYCGTSSRCQCARDSVSAKVSAAKRALPDDQKAEINTKRANTNLARYGVANVGQLGVAKANHKEFYGDQTKVSSTLERIRTTTLDRYGVENVASLEETASKRKASMIERYGHANPMQVPDMVAKARDTKKRLYTDHHIARNNHDRFIRMVRENFSLDALISNDDYIGVQSRPKITFRCLGCDHVFTKRFDYASPPICKVCHPTDISFKSKQELDILEFVRSIYDGNIISGDRNSISPYEIDIYLPDISFGIEHCGLYWHSELSGHKSWNYHHRKWDAAASAGIGMLTIFEDEWLEKRSIVEDMIRSKVGKGVRSITARQCTVGYVARPAAVEFFNTHHLLGAPERLPLTLGLFSGNQIMAAMSFRREDGIWNLIRFATHGMVPGAASRLLSRFIDNHGPNKIITFSDNRYSRGELYEKLGFENIGTVPPMQQYVERYSIRHDKRSMSRDRMLAANPSSGLDDSMTEWEMAKLLGYDRIWDCGKIKWMLEL